MTCRGHFQGGVILLDEPADFKDGDQVSVRLERRAGASEGQAPTLYEQLKEIIGIAEGLPSDLAENHDYYLHGHPKKTS